MNCGTPFSIGLKLARIFFPFIFLSRRVKASFEERRLGSGEDFVLRLGLNVELVGTVTGISSEEDVEEFSPEDEVDWAGDD